MRIRARTRRRNSSKRSKPTTRGWRQWRGGAGRRRQRGGGGSALAKGGMLTKVLAAKRAARSGAQTVIASGREPDVLVRLARGEAVGTLFTTSTVPLAARKQWLADHVTVTG